MKIYLAGLGWVPDAPAGNRLRWHYPVDERVVDSYQGLPKTIIVERAWVDEDLQKVDELGKMVNVGSQSMPIVPYSWWDHFGDIVPAGMMPLIFSLPWSAQAVRFQYQGADTRLLAFDEGGRIIDDRMIVNSSVVGLKAPDIRFLAVFAYNATFLDLMALDLFRDRGLPWEEIARIRVADTVGLTLSEAGSRYDLPPTLDVKEWAELVDAANTALASDPKTETAFPDEPTAWEAFQMMMGTRWEHAVLFGHGFFDRPRNGWAKIDEIRKDLILPGIPPRAVAYRVIDKEGRIKPSNLVVCPPWQVAPLVTPGLPNSSIPRSG